MLAVPISDVSGISEARRRSVEIATRLGFDEISTGRVALIATELATNLDKYAPGGQLLIGTFDDEDGGGIEILSLDTGPGMDASACMRDGYSSGGSQGTGLGAISRQAEVLRVFSLKGKGTALQARIKSGRSQPNTSEGNWSAFAVAKPGEEVCGDAWATRALKSGNAYLVADGLGHGPEAADASTQAVRTLARTQNQTAQAIIAELHSALRPTRGAAVALAICDPSSKTVFFCGVGNIAATIIGPDGQRKLVSMNGTAGHQVRLLKEFTYPYDPKSLLIMHSDGIMSNWSLDNYPGLTAASPSLIAGVIYRDFNRARDDSTVMVVRL